MKPILFNTEMVHAILDGRKTVTRRVVKPQPAWRKLPVQQRGHPEYWANWDDERVYKAPYRPGDILYVRETWAMVGWFSPHIGEWNQQYVYKASYKYDYRFDVPAIEWCPSIHMPREAARIFLRVTNVRVERLQEITPEQIDAEGCKEWAYSAKTGELLPSGPSWFMIAWDNTIKPADLSLYGWDSNPWVWVIEFERCEKPEEAE